ncbi:MAG TPA: hypothetical protein VIW78_12695 [Burkholderiales bacterium]
MALARLEPLVLKPRQARSSPQERWIAALFTLALFSALVWILNMVFGNPFGDLDWDSFTKAFRAFLERAPFGRQIEAVVLVLAPVAHLWYLRRASKYEHLRLDAVGIRYESPLPKSLRPLRPDWSLQWSQVREIRIVVHKVMFHPNLALLEIDAGPVKKKLQALYWSGDAEGKTAEPETWRERFFQGFHPAREREGILGKIEQSPLVRYAREAGVKIDSGGAPGTASGVGLENHPHAIAAMGLVLVLVCYAFVDIGLNEETYAVEPPLVLFALAGAIAVLSGMLWLASVGVSRKTTLVVSLMLGVAVGVALHPGVLRLNEATDTEGLRTYEYRLTAYVAFSPLDSNLPVLEFSKDEDYWRQFKLGTTYQFELRKGGLGFYQVNMQPVHAKVREYFWGRK